MGGFQRDACASQLGAGAEYLRDDERLTARSAGASAASAVPASYSSAMLASCHRVGVCCLGRSAGAACSLKLSLQVCQQCSDPGSCGLQHACLIFVAGTTSWRTVSSVQEQRADPANQIWSCRMHVCHLHQGSEVVGAHGCVHCTCFTTMPLWPRLHARSVPLTWKTCCCLWTCLPGWERVLRQHPPDQSPHVPAPAQGAC